MSKFIKKSKPTGPLITLVLLLLIYACEVEKMEPAQPTPDVEETIPESEDSTPNKPDSTSNDKGETNKLEKVNIGDGSGRVIIKDVKDKEYTITPGTYWRIEIENVDNIVVDGLDDVKVVGGNINISGVNNLTVRRISLENNSQSAIYIENSANNLMLEDLKIKNIKDWVIRFNIDKKYDGSPESYSENIQLKNLYAENIGSLFVSKGEIKADGFYGLIKGFKLSNSRIINSPNLSNGIYLGCGEEYEISNNLVNNVNKSNGYPNGNNNHNGIFHVNGNGKLFGNKITNHQGNAVRSWLYSITKPNATVEIFNNIVYNSTRYSAFEVQVIPTTGILPSFNPANARIYNNTVGRMNTGQPKFYEGRIVDIYNTKGLVEVFDNLYFNMRDNVVSLNQSNRSETKVDEKNNIYFDNDSDAVVDLENLKSKVPGVGAH